MFFGPQEVDMTVIESSHMHVCLQRLLSRPLLTYVRARLVLGCLRGFSNVLGVGVGVRKRLRGGVVRKQGFSLPSINDLGVVAKEAVPRLPYRKRPSTSLNPSEKAWGPKNWAQGPF